jgi:hypothetical protein
VFLHGLFFLILLSGRKVGKPTNRNSVDEIIEDVVMNVQN